MQNGRSHLEEAVAEYRRVLFLDPSNQSALASLDRLRAQKGDGAHTVTMDAVAPVATAAAATRLHAQGAAPKAIARAKPSIPAWAIGVVAAMTLVLAGSLWFMHSRATGRNAQQHESLALKANASDGDTHAASPDSTAVANPNPVPTNDVTKPTMSASASDADITNIGGAKAPVPAPAKHAPAPKPVRTAPVEQGSLSVYFLGGVGDVWIDGKLFPHQPPFEKAPLAAGKHRVSCRMSEDNQTREITVTIRPEKETVIEYEVGAKPVASDE
jgi:hypothetical protein